VGIDSGGDHPRVVQEQQIAGLEKPWEIGQIPMINTPGGTIEEQQLGGAAGRRLLRDEFSWQLEIEVVGSHRRMIKHRAPIWPKATFGQGEEFWLGQLGTRCC
jgi:hypothetical protein